MTFLLSPSSSAVMPKRFTPAQLAAAASAGKPRAKASFPGDEAWHAYQDSWFTTFTSGEVLEPRSEESSRASRWKAAVRQHGQIEAHRVKSEESAPADILAKRLKVSDKWIAVHALGLQQLAAASPQVSPAGGHATRRISAAVMTPAGDNVGATHHVDVRYSLPPCDGESAQAAAQPPPDSVPMLRHRSRPRPRLRPRPRPSPHLRLSRSPRRRRRKRRRRQVGQVSLDGAAARRALREPSTGVLWKRALARRWRPT